MKKLNILFLSLYSFSTLSEGYICADLVHQFRDEGHNIIVFTPDELSNKTIKTENEGITHYRIACGQIQKTTAIKKIFGLRKLDAKSKKIIKKDFSSCRFDLVICMVSHCAYFNTVKYVKKMKGAFVYNMVKDIFPQNAVDLGMIKKDGLIYKWFRRKENKYYEISNCIGAISPKSEDFLRSDNKKLQDTCFEVNPNSVIPREVTLSNEEKHAIRDKYSIPKDKTVFIYGGNLGKPQGIDFLLDIAKYNENREGNAYFFVVGNGTEYNKIEEFFVNNNIVNTRLMNRLPVDEFEKLCCASDVGLVFLNKSFTVPNYPSRILSYMQAKLPIICAVDSTCDAGEIAKENGYGYNCLNGDLEEFFEYVKEFEDDKEKCVAMGQKAFNFLCENYTVKNSYDIIMKHLGE